MDLSLLVVAVIVDIILRIRQNRRMNESNLATHRRVERILMAMEVWARFYGKPASEAKPFLDEIFKDMRS